MDNSGIDETVSGHIEHRTLSERAYDLMRRDILKGALAPDAKLRVETLRRGYGLSGAPVREALTRLTGDRLVTFEGQRGFRVAPISADDFADLCAVRRQIEIEAMRQSISLANSKWEEGVRQAFGRLAIIEDRLPALQDETYELWEIRNREFHAALLSNCPSGWLHRIYDLLFQQAERYRRITFASGRKISRDVCAEHRLIMDAALARDSDAACGLAASHINKTLAIYARIEREGDTQGAGLKQ